MCFWALAAVLSSTVARAQDGPPPRRNMLQSGIPEEGGPPPFGDRMELLGLGGVHGGPVVTNVPFCATSTTTQTLADGKTTITRTGTVCRDAEGRVSTEMTPAGGSYSVVVIRDPVAHKLTLLRPDQKSAYVSDMPSHGAQGGPGNGQWKGRAGANVEETPLGPQTIGAVNGVGGLNAQGTRYKRIIRAAQIGANQDIVSVSEQWYCTDWKVICMTIHTDPWSGTVTHTLSSFTTNVEPAKLTVPPGYTMKEGGPRGGMRRFRGGPPPADAPVLPPPSN
jgi:hypothetical protein